MTRDTYKLLLFSLALGAYGCQDGQGPFQVSHSRGSAITNDNDDNIDNDVDGTVENNPTANSDPTGVISTLNIAGPISTDPNSNFFFAKVGTNGRTCHSCHRQGQDWTISAAKVQDIFNRSDGLNPLFRTVDGSNRPDADVSTEDARETAYSLLLQRGVIRIGDTLGLNPPAVADYSIDSVTDPYGYANPTRVSFFRRPLPSTNVSFLTHVMWDGREDQCTRSDLPSLAPTGCLDCVAAASNAALCVFSLDASLRHQANDATMGHAQGSDISNTGDPAQIAGFQEANFTAQSRGQGVGSTTAQNATGGPEALAGLPVGQNVNKGTMDDFTVWASVNNQNRQAVARGQALFNGPVFFNNTSGTPVAFSCTGCHNVGDVGSRAVNGGGAFVDLNLADASDGGAVNPGPLPVYSVRCVDPSSCGICTTPNDPTTCSTAKKCLAPFSACSFPAPRSVTDLGRGFITGLFADVGKFKVPVLRGLSGRAPYFHNGSRATLLDVFNFYISHFQLTRDNVGTAVTDQDKSDMVQFLQVL